MMRVHSSILPKMQECQMKIYTVPVHSFSVPKLDWLLIELRRNLKLCFGADVGTNKRKSRKSRFFERFCSDSCIL